MAAKEDGNRSTISLTFARSRCGPIPARSIGTAGTRAGSTKHTGMEALVLEGPAAAIVRDVPDPAEAGRALLRVERVGVCGTDASIFKGKIKVGYPLVMGHEMVGVVETPGERKLFP